MYTEAFKFTFLGNILDSERMELLSEMFKLTEDRSIGGESYGGYKINSKGEVSFWSYYPDLTSIVVGWLREKHSQGKLNVSKPSYTIENED